MRKLAAFLSTYAEDLALAVGCLLASVGVAVALTSWAYGSIALGVLLMAYGVWITERRH